MQVDFNKYHEVSPGTLAQIECYLWRGIQISKVMKCSPNYTLQEDKISNLWIKLDRNANPNVANVYFRLRLKGTLCDVYQSFVSV